MENNLSQCRELFDEIIAALQEEREERPNTAHLLEEALRGNLVGFARALVACISLADKLETNLKYFKSKMN